MRLRLGLSMPLPRIDGASFYVQAGATKWSNDSSDDRHASLPQFHDQLNRRGAAADITTQTLIVIELPWRPTIS